MRRHAHLWCRKIEGYLNYNDHYDVSQTLFRLRHVTMPQQKSRPSANDSHDTTRSTNEFGYLHETEYHQTHDACTGGKARNQIAHCEPARAYGPFQGWAKNIKSENVEKQ